MAAWVEIPSAKGPAGSLLAGRTIAVLLAVILSGLLPFMSFYMRASTWLFWLLLLYCIQRFRTELPIPRLVRPIGPYMVWLICYLLWGLIIAVVPAYFFVAKTVFMTLLFSAAAAILCARPRILVQFANAAQFAVFGNILLMLLWSRVSFIDQIMTTVTHRSAFVYGVDRYSGLWGNPNAGGYVCLLATILSVLAVPWVAWLGRLSTLPLLYLSASRKAAVLYLVIMVLYMVLVHTRDLKFWIRGLTVAFLLVIGYSLSQGLRTEVHSAATQANTTRLMDLEEKQSQEGGYGTRATLFHDWTRVLVSEPWYGYGLRAMAGDLYDEQHPGQLVHKGLLDVGTHNTYLGVLVEVGPAGLLAFILTMLFYARQCLRSRQSPTGRWVLVSLTLVNLVYLFFSHDHLFESEGQIAFCLFFLLPAGRALRDLTTGLDHRSA